MRLLSSPARNPVAVRQRGRRPRWRALRLLLPLLLLFGGGAALSALASERTLSFEPVAAYPGLSQVTVNAICQDSLGFIWVGTGDGLNRYNGYEFTAYRSLPFDISSLSGNRITALCEDRNRRLWVGTFANGLNLYDRRGECFSRVPLVRDGGREHNGYEQVTAIAADGAGAVWVGVRGAGLYRLGPQNPVGIEGAAARFGKDEGDPESLRSDQVMCLLADSRGTLWVGTADGLDSIDDAPAANDPSPRPVFRHWEVGGPGRKPPCVTAIAEDAGGVIWLGTSAGLFRLDGASGAFVPQPLPAAGNDGAPGTIHAICKSPAGDPVGQGALWLATDGGLVIYHEVSGAFSRPRHDPDDPRSIFPGGVIALGLDRGGVLWIGSEMYGLHKYDPQSARFPYPKYEYRSPSGKILNSRSLRVRSFCQTTASGKDLLWIGAEQGLFRVDRATGRLEPRALGPATPGGAGAVYSILEDGSGRLWCGSERGLVRHDPRTGRDTVFRTGLPSAGAGDDDRVYRVFLDRDSRIWVVTDGTFSLLDADDRTFRHYRYDRRSPDLYDEPPVPAIHQDGDGTFWLGTGSGFFRFSEQTGEFERFLNDPGDTTSLSCNVVLNILPDPREPDRYLWLGTAGGGLDRFDRSTRTFTHLTQRDGLANNHVSGLLTDDRGRLWMSSNRGLTCFDPVSRKLKNYDTCDGLQCNEFTSGAAYRNGRGEMFFGGSRGFNVFHPAEVSDNPFVPPVVITDLKVNSRSVSFREPNTCLESSVVLADEVTFSPAERIITFEFAALSYSAPRRNQYAFKLENFNQDWIPIGTRREATFTNLDPGTYVFRVRAANSDGVWNEEGRSVRITVEPPIWRAWWAYPLYVLAGAALLFSVRRYELGRVVMKHRLELLQKDVKLAAKIQRLLMPDEAPQRKGYQFAGRNRPTRGVGGDYFDFIAVEEGRLGICLGDVTGKGLPAALVMANLQGIVRNQLQLTSAAGKCMERSNRLLFQNTDGDTYITFFCGILDTVSHRFSFCNAGHDFPFLYSAGGESSRLHTDDFFLGFRENAAYGEQAVTLAPGDVLVIFSDGITEAGNKAGEEFGEERLAVLIEHNRQLDAEALADAIFDAVGRHTGRTPQQDDMTLVVVKRDGGGPAAGSSPPFP